MLYLFNFKVFSRVCACYFSTLVTLEPYAEFQVLNLLQIEMKQLYSLALTPFPLDLHKSFMGPDSQPKPCRVHSPQQYPAIQIRKALSLRLPVCTILRFTDKIHQ